MSSETLTIADVQSSSDQRKINVNKVGVKNVRHPIVISPIKVSSDGTSEIVSQHAVATFDMFVSLPHDVKGTHMSRFIEILNAGELHLDPKNFHALLFEVANKLHSNHAYITISFPYFIKKHAPVSKAASLMDYEVAMMGSRENNQSQSFLKVAVPVTSLCPCSKEISNYGAHNQRSLVTVTAENVGNLWFDDLITLVEKNASCDLYGILKRPDEKYVTEKAYDNPKFVEDVVRDITQTLLSDDRVGAFTVESENFESIHNHSAYAMIEKKK